MAEQPSEYNTLYAEMSCPHCGKPVTSGIGFRVGALLRRSYWLGDKLLWEGGRIRPEIRPADGRLSTIGYFECENPRCPSWQDCFPAVQEALIAIADDVICDVRPTEHKPGQQNFDIIKPSERSG